MAKESYQNQVVSFQASQWCFLSLKPIENIIFTHTHNINIYTLHIYSVGFYLEFWCLD